MKQSVSILRNEDGSIMLIGMLVLMLATIIGIAATTTSSIEVGIAANEKVYKQNFYRAEAAAMCAAQMLQNEMRAHVLKKPTYGTDDVNEDGTTEEWMRNRDPHTKLLDGLPQPTDICHPENWDPEQNASGQAFSEDALGSSCAQNVRYMAIHVGQGAGRNELGTETGAVHQIAIFGRADLAGSNQGSVIIEIGFKKFY